MKNNEVNSRDGEDKRIAKSKSLLSRYFSSKQDRNSLDFDEIIPGEQDKNRPINSRNGMNDYNISTIRQNASDKGAVPEIGS